MADVASGSLLAFALLSLVVELTPGPNMAYLAALSLSRGARTGLAAVAGIALGLSAYGVAAAYGLAALVGQSAFLYEALRWAGIVYLLWLAWEGWATEHETSPSRVNEGALSAWAAFRRGLITNLPNPKAAVFYIAVTPKFVDAQLGSVARQTLILSAVYVAVATMVHATIVVLASSAQTLIETAEQRRTTRRVLALALVGVAIWFGFSTARN